MPQAEQSQADVKGVKPIYAIILAIVGVLFIIEADTYGARLSAGQLLYDTGLALLTAAVIEVLLMRVLVAVSQRKGDLRRIEQRIAALDAAAADRLAQWERGFAQLKQQVLEATIERIEGKVDALDSKVSLIHRKLS